MVFNKEPRSWMQSCWLLFPTTPRELMDTDYAGCQQAIDISESTLYPVLRRLQKDGCLETYDMEYAGRNRRYYRITDAGTASSICI